jgi:hypothetical protein
VSRRSEVALADALDATYEADNVVSLHREDAVALAPRSSALDR